jgi:cytoskeletal protein RodZ
MFRLITDSLANVQVEEPKKPEVFDIKKGHKFDVQDTGTQSQESLTICWLYLCTALPLSTVRKWLSATVMDIIVARVTVTTVTTPAVQAPAAAAITEQTATFGGTPTAAAGSGDAPAAATAASDEEAAAAAIAGAVEAVSAPAAAAPGTSAASSRTRVRACLTLRLCPAAATVTTTTTTTKYRLESVPSNSKEIVYFLIHFDSKSASIRPFLS